MVRHCRPLRKERMPDSSAAVIQQKCIEICMADFAELDRHNSSLVPSRARQQAWFRAARVSKPGSEPRASASLVPSRARQQAWFRAARLSKPGSEPRASASPVPSRARQQAAVRQRFPPTVRLFGQAEIMVRAILFAALALCPAAWTQSGAPVVLTDAKPTGSFPVSAATVNAPPSAVDISVTGVHNPGETALGIYVYLEGSSAGKPAAPRVLIGNFSLYPSDRPAGFVLPVAGAFDNLKGQSRAVKGVRLALEIRRLRADASWKDVEVTVAPPHWRMQSK